MKIRSRSKRLKSLPSVLSCRIPIELNTNKAASVLKRKSHAQIATALLIRGVSTLLYEA